MDEKRVQSVRNAWINCLRKEALEKRRADVSACVQIGVWIATFADADGSKSYPSAETLGGIVHCTDETVGRAVKVLLAVGLLQRRRRRNKESEYQLVMPVQPVDWDEHLHLYTDTRQKRRKAELKKKAIAKLLAAQEEAEQIDKVVPERVSEPVSTRDRDIQKPVPAGSSEGAENRETRSGTVEEPVPERSEEVQKPVPAGGDQDNPASGRDPEPQPQLAEPVPRPTVRAGARGEDDFSRVEAESTRPGRRCAGPGCSVPLIRPGRTLCSGCERITRGAAQEPQKPVQGAFTMLLPTRAPNRPVEDVMGILRVCGCGREYRGQKPGQCSDCIAAQHQHTANSA